MISDRDLRKGIIGEVVAKVLSSKLTLGLVGI